MNGSVNSTLRKAMHHTVTGLKRWSITGRDLPRRILAGTVAHELTIVSRLSDQGSPCI